MALKPANWSVVVVGRWNPAILTPAGIAGHVFGLDPSHPIEVLVPIDGLSPHIVKHPEHALTARLDERRLRIEVEQPDYATLGKAMSAGRRVLGRLPVTPFGAAGINVHFRTGDDMEKMTQILSAGVDAPLGDLGHAITVRTLGRTLTWGEGVINLRITGSEKGFEVRFNLHRAASAGASLINWLGLGLTEIEDCIRGIVHGLGLEIEEAADGNGNER